MTPIKRMTLDLNNPEHAKIYVLAWVDQDDLNYERPTDLLNSTGEDYLRVAKQLFMYVDPRKALGDGH